MTEGRQDPDATRERYEGDTQERSWDANVKRTYDEYQQESLESIRRNRAYVDKILSDAQQADNERQRLGNLALSNAIDTANLVNKQAAAHRDIAINHVWNLEPSEAAAQSHVLPVAQVEAIRAVVLAILAELGLVGKDK